MAQLDRGQQIVLTIFAAMFYCVGIYSDSPTTITTKRGNTVSAQVIYTTCTYCNGTGMAEQLLERTINGDWVKNTQLDHALADAWMADDKLAPLKWEDCVCPICLGAGHYEIEFTPCKIF